MMGKAQYFYIDYFISIFIIFISLVMFYGVISTSSSLDDGSLYELVQEGDTVSNSLLTRGYPYEWDSTHVMKIGIASESNSNKLDSTKVREFATLAKSDYYETKALFGSKMDYGLFFLDSINEAVNVNGVCKIGKDTIIKNEGWSSIAYYHDNEDNQYLKGNMSEYGARLFNSTGGSDVDGDWLDLIADLDSFNILVLEDPRLETNTDFSSNSVAHINAIEAFVDDGGTIILTRDVDVADFLGVHFNSGTHAGNGNLNYQFSPLKDDYLNLVWNVLLGVIRSISECHR